MANSPKRKLRLYVDELVQPFMGWKFLRQDSKRKILSATMAEIHVADYLIHGLYLNSAVLGSSNEMNRTTAGSLVAASHPRLFIPLNL